LNHKITSQRSRSNGATQGSILRDHLQPQPTTYGLSCANHQPDDVFESIESAHQYIALLAEVANDTKRELDTDISIEDNSQFPQRLDALRLASYDLKKLCLHIHTISRILNDLRSIRGFLFQVPSTEVQQRNLRSPKPSAVRSRTIARTQ
jgi:hypothetical protein